MKKKDDVKKDKFSDEDKERHEKMIDDFIKDNSYMIRVRIFTRLPFIKMKMNRKDLEFLSLMGQCFSTDPFPPGFIKKSPPPEFEQEEYNRRKYKPKDYFR